MMMMSKVSSSENTTVAAAATEADDIIISQKEILTSKAEISEIKQENERLKMKLSQVIKDYRSLQTQFDHQDDPKLQMSLSLGDLGRCGSSHLHTEEEEEEEEVTKHGEEKFEQELGLQLGLNIGFENKTKEKQEEQEEEEEKKEGWVTRKILKNMRSKRGDDDDEFSYNPIKKARVSVRTRYDGIMMNDGCQWRKYGQKVAKGNPCPRSYYRCTAAPECPVRKQVQRFVEDMSILTTTYEGKHNHPLSEAASSMAKTTSMAMNMLLSKSSQSKAGGTSLAPISTITSINGVNYSLTTNNIPHLSTISPSHPTITLDLTLSQSSSSSSSSSSSPLQQNQWRRLGLMSSNTTATGGLYQFESIPNKILNLNYQGQAQQQSFYKSHAGLSDTITVATKAIALDPSFQSALAATVASVLGARGGGAGEMGRRIEGLKMEDRILSSLLPNYLPSSSSSSSSTTLNTNLLLTQHQNQHNHRRHHPASIPFSNHMNNEHGRSPFSANRE